MLTRLCCSAFILMAASSLSTVVDGADTSRGSTSGSNLRESTAARQRELGGVDYVLQPQDVLRIHIFQHDDINRQTESVSISNAFTIFLPLIQAVNVKGKTARESEELVRAAYDRDFLVNPQVSITVVKYAERAVNVVGQVNKPGRIQFPPERGLTIVEALSEAGGPTRLADLKKVKLSRRNTEGETTIEEVNVDAMWNRGGRDAIPLQKDDVIYVPERII